MQHKTENRFGWFGLLMIAIISGLVVKVIGDPLVDVIGPNVEEAAEEVEDLWQDQDWGEEIGENLNEWLDQNLKLNQQNNFL